MGCRFLVTGAAGFIGSRVVRRLAAAWPGEVAAAVRDRLDEPPPGVVRHVVDLGCAEEVRSLVAQVRPACVVHLGALMGTHECLADPDECHRVNVRGLTSLLDACAASGVERFVFTSSCNVYGRGPVPFREEDVREDQASPYPRSKRQGELLVEAFGARTGATTVVLRVFSVYGEGQRPDRVVGAVVGQVEAGEPVRVFGSLEASRDYLHVEDCVEGVVAACSRGQGQVVVNLGSGRPVTMGELVGLVESVVGRRARVEVVPERPGEVLHVLADTTRQRWLLGFQPRVGMAEGVERYVRWRRASDRAEPA